jgi:hypothetical protein
MAYATVDELAQALRLTGGATPENTPTLQACLDAAAVEIDHAVDWRPVPEPPVEPPPELPGLPLLNRVNVLRGVEWWKSNDAAFGVIGFDQTGALQAPRDGFARHARTLAPVKQQFGIA